MPNHDKENRLIHYYRFNDEKTVLCGELAVNSVVGSNYIGLVTCVKCKDIYMQTAKKCCVCQCILTDDEANDTNAFYQSCSMHKNIAQALTTQFFIENPNYLEWGTPKHNPKN